jgi:hypothetical protein
LAGPVLLDNKFLDLVKNKIGARATAAVRNTITRQKLWTAFGGWWETEIKTKYDGGNRTFFTGVPFEFMRTDERRTRIGTSAPNLTLDE